MRGNLKILDLTLQVFPKSFTHYKTPDLKKKTQAIIMTPQRAKSVSDFNMLEIPSKVTNDNLRVLS